MSTLKIHLFGQLRLHRNGRCLDKFPTIKARDLFCYLLLRRQRFHARNVLAGLFWGDSSEEQARKCLRTTLWRIRSTLEPDGSAKETYLIIKDEEIAFSTRSDYWLDVEEFEHRLAAPQLAGAMPDVTRQFDGETVRGLIEAVDLYQGDLLEGCYEDWCLYERERLQGMFLGALATLMVGYRGWRAYEEAIRCGQRILSYDPVLEEAHRELMRLHYLSGNRGAALRQYHLCRDILSRELGVEPMEETTALYVRISQRKALFDEEPTPPDIVPIALSGRHAAGSPRATLPLLFQVNDVLDKLRLVQADFQDLGAHFQSGMRALETISRELDRAEKDHRL